jgi:tetratricopeptide (TPR) repeat protein
MQRAADAESSNAAGDPAACLRLALAAERDKDAVRALAFARQAVALDAGNPEVHYALGRIHKSCNDAVAAEEAYRGAIRLAPDFLNAWVSLGILQRALGRHADAESSQREALRIDPRSYLAHLNLGSALLEQGRFAEAADSFRRTLELKCDSAEAHNNLARALLALHDPSCLEHFQEALRLKPDYFSAAEGMGTTLKRLGDYEGAARALLLATKLQPDAIEPRLRLGHSYLATGRVAEATGEFEHLLRVRPGWAKAKAGLASALAMRGQYTRPKALFEAAIGESGGDPLIRMSFAVFLLISGEYAEAWNHYESRLVCPGAAPRKLPAPRWSGEPLEGRRLLVTCEQGLGDELNFASIFPDAIAAAGACTIECDTRLETLFRRSFPRATLVGVERKRTEGWHHWLEQNLDRIPPFDYWIPNGSLPLHYRASADSFPKSGGGYLIADPQRVAYWRARLASLGPGLRVGISWRGGVALTNSAARTLTLGQLKPILGVAGVQFVSLQYGDCREELDSFAAASGHRIHLWQDAIDDYDETAALVSSLDLVISVCTGIVHLAGGLDRPVWVMAPLSPGWRYGRQGPTMIWYSSVRIFRQEKASVWDRMISNVTRGLQRVVKGEEPLRVAARLAT